MQHTIFITVDEFLSNGGVLKGSRSLFMQDYNNWKEIGTFEDNLNTAENLDKGLVIVQATNKSFQLTTDITFVQINCTPHYV